MSIIGSRHATLDLLDWQVLRYEPFAGEDADVHLLADRMVVARAEHPCQHCDGAIRPGERVRRRSEVNREERRTMAFYFCADCCEAMRALVVDGDDGLLMARFQCHHVEAC